MAFYIRFTDWIIFCEETLPNQLNTVYPTFSFLFSIFEIRVKKTETEFKKCVSCISHWHAEVNSPGYITKNIIWNFCSSLLCSVIPVVSTFSFFSSHVPCKEIIQPHSAVTRSKERKRIRGVCGGGFHVCGLPYPFSVTATFFMGTWKEKRILFSGWKKVLNGFQQLKTLSNFLNGNHTTMCAHTLLLSPSFCKPLWTIFLSHGASLHKLFNLLEMEYFAKTKKNQAIHPCLELS